MATSKRSRQLGDLNKRRSSQFQHELSQAIRAYDVEQQQALEEADPTAYYKLMRQPYEPAISVIGRPLTNGEVADIQRWLLSATLSCWATIGSGALIALIVPELTDTERQAILAFDPTVLF